jgi:uncharacterized protein (TIGR02284 family)
MPENIVLETVVSALKDLIEKLRDGQHGFKELGHRLQDEGAKRFFLEETQRRAEYAAELENELHRMGVHDVNVSPSHSGNARLVWGEVQASLAGGQKALLSTAKRSDDVTSKAYVDALKENLPLPLREMLDRQHAHIQRAQDQVAQYRVAQ